MRDFIQKSCGNKSRYPTPESAGNYAAKCKRDRGVDLRIYSCAFCGGFHLTSVLDFMHVQAPEAAPKFAVELVRCKSGHEVSPKIVDNCPICIDNREKKKIKDAERIEKQYAKRVEKDLEQYRLWAENRIENEN